eukprot:5210584-Prymnesium_polylepis.3
MRIRASLASAEVGAASSFQPPIAAASLSRARAAAVASSSVALGGSATLKNAPSFAPLVVRSLPRRAPSSATDENVRGSPP